MADRNRRAQLCGGSRGAARGTSAASFMDGSDVTAAAVLSLVAEGRVDLGDHGVSAEALAALEARSAGR